MAHQLPKILCQTCKKCRGIVVDDHFGRLESICALKDFHVENVSVRGVCRYYEEDGAEVSQL